MATHLAVSKDHQKLDTLIRIPALWPALGINTWKLFSARTDIIDMILPIIDNCQVNMSGPNYVVSSHDNISIRGIS